MPRKKARVLLFEDALNTRVFPPSVEVHLVVRERLSYDSAERVRREYGMFIPNPIREIRFNGVFNQNIQYEVAVFPPSDEGFAARYAMSNPETRVYVVGNPPAVDIGPKNFAVRSWYTICEYIKELVYGNPEKNENKPEDEDYAIPPSEGEEEALE